MDVKFHDRFFVSDIYIWVQCAIIKKLFDSVHSRFCGFGCSATIVLSAMRSVMSTAWTY